MTSGGYFADESEAPLVRAVPGPLVGLLRLTVAFVRAAWGALLSMLPALPCRKAWHRWYEARGIVSSGS